MQNHGWSGHHIAYDRVNNSGYKVTWLTTFYYMWKVVVVELRLCLFNCIQYVIFVVSRGRNTVDLTGNNESLVSESLLRSYGNIKAKKLVSSCNNSMPTSMLAVSNWPTLTVRIAAQPKNVNTLITYCIRSLFVVSCGLCWSLCYFLRCRGLVLPVRLFSSLRIPCSEGLEVRF